MKTLHQRRLWGTECSCTFQSWMTLIRENNCSWRGDSKRLKNDPHLLEKASPFLGTFPASSMWTGMQRDSARCLQLREVEPFKLSWFPARNSANLSQVRVSVSQPDRHQVWSLTPFYSVDFSQIKDRCKQVSFQQTHNQSLRQLLLTVSWNLPA